MKVLQPTVHSPRIVFKLLVFLFFLPAFTFSQSETFRIHITDVLCFPMGLVKTKVLNSTTEFLKNEFSSYSKTDERFELFDPINSNMDYPTTFLARTVGDEFVNEEVPANSVVDIYVTASIRQDIYSVGLKLNLDYYYSSAAGIISSVSDSYDSSQGFKNNWDLFLARFSRYRISERPMDYLVNRINSLRTFGADLDEQQKQTKAVEFFKFEATTGKCYQILGDVNIIQIHQEHYKSEEKEIVLKPAHRAGAEFEMLQLKVEIENENVELSHKFKQSCLSIEGNLLCPINKDAKNELIDNYQLITDGTGEAIEKETMTITHKYYYVYPEFSTDSEITDIVEINCGIKVSGYTVKMIQEALVREGYLHEVSSNVLNTETKKALNKFQRDNNLPVGGLDTDTLNALGLKLGTEKE